MCSYVQLSVSMGGYLWLCVALCVVMVRGSYL